MKHRALVVYEFHSLRGAWVESSTSYYVRVSHSEFLTQLVETFNCYNDLCRIKSITFFESYV